MNLYNTANLNAKLVLEWKNGALEIPFVKSADLYGGWSTWEAVLDGIPENADIRKMIFRFSHTDCRYPFVNLEKVRLWKK